ncbi:MAG: DivIVA domain-containing protein [Firmicutes bacterium]|nr:DivIVA domain-containing protein [Bacillota bacterium]
MLTPVDLETTVFRRGFRGYRVHEVQEFMARLTKDYERLYRENIELKEKIEAYEAKLANYREAEQTLQNALLLAEKTAEEIKQTSQKQAELLLQEAEHRAEQIRTRVKEEVRAELEYLAHLKRQADFFRLQLKNFLLGLAELTERHFDLQAAWEEIFKRGAGDSPSPIDEGGTPVGQERME